MTLLSRFKRWLPDRRLSRDARRVKKDRLSYLTPEKMRRIEQTLAQIRERGVPGDLIEFGIALGGSAIVIARHAGPGCRFFGLDVFEMIPPPTSEKDDEKSRSRFEIIRSGMSRGIGGDTYYGYRDNLYEEVKSSFRRYGLDPDGEQIRLVPGLFEDSWPTLDIRKVAFAHVDCDWYDPVRFCLASLADIMAPGGAIMIDDYHDYGGCRIAVDEFLGKRSDFAFEAGPNPVLRKL
jgi:O-methyltransferase